MYPKFLRIHLKILLNVWFLFRWTGSEFQLNTKIGDLEQLGWWIVVYEKCKHEL